MPKNALAIHVDFDGLKDVGLSLHFIEQDAVMADEQRTGIAAHQIGDIEIVECSIHAILSNATRHGGFAGLTCTV